VAIFTPAGSIRKVEGDEGDLHLIRAERREPKAAG
jgi:hypothetical protein